MAVGLEGTLLRLCGTTALTASAKKVLQVQQICAESAAIAL
jgi:hypothetical protein